METQRLIRKVAAMADKKIIYFIEGGVPTSGEQLEIDALQKLVTPGYTLAVRSATKNLYFGDADNIEPCDYVAGTVPTAYVAKDVISPDMAGLLVASPDAIADLDHEATKQLQVFAILGTSIADLSAEDVTASENITYVSSVVGKATVSATGLITAVAAGNTVITITYEYADGLEIETTVDVTVVGS
jgi:hypothetical protein